MCLGANRAGPPSAFPFSPLSPIPSRCVRRCGLSPGRVPITRGIARKNQPRINQPLPLLRSPSRFLSISLFLRRGKFELSLEATIECNSRDVHEFSARTRLESPFLFRARELARESRVYAIDREDRGVVAIIYADCTKSFVLRKLLRVQHGGDFWSRRTLRDK